MDTSASASQQTRSQPLNTNDSKRSEFSGVQPVRSAIFKGPKRKRLAKVSGSPLGVIFEYFVYINIVPPS